MLSVKGLRVVRGGRPVLDGVSFELAPGQMTAVLGLNGAGKTTLLRAILGFCPRAAGEVAVDGELLDGMSASRRARKLAYVPQRYDGGFSHPVEEFVAMGVTAYLGAFSQPGRDSLRRAAEILRELGCAHLIGRPMDGISGGECRIAYLARAIMQDAGYLLLDEPVASLDFSRQHIFLSGLRRHVAARGAGCLLTLHAPELACAYAGRILILHQNRLLLDLARGDADFEARLSAALVELYGPAVRPRFLDGTLALGWAEP